MVLPGAIRSSESYCRIHCFLERCECCSRCSIKYRSDKIREPPRPCGRGFCPRRSVGVARHHRLHATATNWSGPEGLVNDWACLCSLGGIPPAKARFWALPRALALRRCTLRCASRWPSDQRSTARRYVTRITASGPIET